MWQKLLNILLILTALLILGVSIHEVSNKYPNKQEDTILHQERVGVVEEKEENEKGDEQDIIKQVQSKRSGLGMASWYGKEVCGTSYGTPQCKTASGEIFDETKLTFASRFLEFGTRVEFCYGGNCVVCRRTDYGPAVWTNRTFDLSRACFDSLADLSKGVIEVSWTRK